MTMADVIVEIDWASDPGDALSAATWTDVTSYVREGIITRGRQQELDEFQPGTCRLVLDNSDQRFDPNNTSGPYAPNVKKLKRVRVRAVDPLGSYSDVYSDTYGSFTQFVGYIEDFELGWRMPNDGHVTLDCVDAFGLFARASMPDSLYEYLVSESNPHWWWRLGDDSGTTALDYGTVGSNLAYVDSPTLGVGGLIEHDSDSAVQFDGSGGRVVGAPAELPAVAGDYTVEFVVNFDRISTDTTIWTFIGRVGSQFVCLLNGLTGKIKVVDRDAGAMAATTSMTAGNTYHVAVTVESSSTIKVYVNGTDVSTASSVTGTELRGTQDVVLGHIDFTPDPVFGPFYTVFEGTLDEWAVYTSALSAATVSDHASAVSTAWNGDTAGERVGNVLDVLAGWPSADRDVDTGQTTFGDADLNDDSTVLQYLQRCEQSENGHFFVARDGNVRLVERHALIVESLYNSSQATFDDSPTGSELPYHDLRLDHGSLVYNDVTVQRKFGGSQNVRDAASEVSYKERSLSKSGLLMDSDVEARSAAQWLLNRFKNERTVVRRIELRPVSVDAMWGQVLVRDLMERVTVEFDPPGAGDTISQESHIQGLEHRFRPMVWETTWFLSPVDTVDYLILDDATFGKLDSNALAY